jgi:hypothetical protein
MLDSSKFCISYHKRVLIDLGKIQNESIKNFPYKIDKLQQYNPIYSQFFDLNKTNYNQIAMNHPRHIVDLNSVMNINTKKIEETEIFVKFSPLLDPIRYMIGKYDLKDENLKELPNLSSTIETCSNKILDSSNASYVDNFFYFLTSIMLNHHNFFHGVDYFGSFLGIQNKFKMNIEDDLEYLTGSSFFLENIGKLMTLENFNEEDINFGDPETRKYRSKLIIIEDPIIIEADEIILDNDEVIENKQIIQLELIELGVEELIFETNLDNGISLLDNNSDCSSIDSSDNSDLNYSTCSEKDDKKDDDSISSNSSWEDVNSDESSTLHEDAVAYINDFPVQMICLEKCEGTLDDLLLQDLIDEKNGSSILFQIIMTLLVYQKVFDFTHNDLHTNNIMYISTTKKFLWYKYENNYYKVPTYGKIFKIIDFGRSIYRFQGKQFCSDSFSVDGDGSTQYNCKTFVNNTKPIIEPNPSFDLCRLACSIYDFVIDDDTDKKNLNNLQKTIERWITDDNGHNVLYKKKGGDERYPGFKLYKMIARTVHNHTPKEQLKEPYFKQFLVPRKNLKQLKSVIDQSVQLIDIDILPSYI